jgi:hypothetical protein
MNVLLLGSDPRCEPLLHSLTTVPGHRVESIPDAGVESRIVNVAEFDGLISAGPLRPLLSQVREFLGAGKPVMVIPSAAQGSDVAYELLAVDDEAGGRLVAGFPHRYDPGWRKLKERIQREAGEELQLIQIQRRLPRTPGSGALSYQAVDELLLNDADLLGWLGVDYTQVTCLHTGATDAGVTRATVTLAGSSPPEAVWTVERDTEGERCEVTVSAADASFSMSGTAGGDRFPAAAECAAGLLADLERISQRQPPEAMWMDAVRAFDVVDAARRSVRRQRTVEISSGEVSERGQFKTKMTALGCSLLSFTFFGVLLALLIGAVFDPRDPMQRRSEAAGFVLQDDAFVPDTPALSVEGQHQLLDVSKRIRETPAEIIVASGPSAANAALDEARRETVVDFLREEKSLDLDTRVVVRPLAGRGFQRFMTGLWIAVFLPLGLFLALQILIVLTRSPETGVES